MSKSILTISFAAIWIILQRIFVYTFVCNRMRGTTTTTTNKREEEEEKQFNDCMVFGSMFCCGTYRFSSLNVLIDVAH